MIRTFLIQAIIFTTILGCKRTDTKLTPTSNNDKINIELNVTYGEDFLEPQGAFTLSFQNNDQKDYTNCEITLNKKYRHSFNGLIEKEKGTLHSSDLKAGQKLTFMFSNDVSNGLLFEIKDKEFKRPNIIEFSCDSGKIQWKW